MPKAQIKREEFEEMLSEHTMTAEDIDSIIEDKFKNIPRISYGTEPPKELKSGDLFYQIE